MIDPLVCSFPGLAMAPFRYTVLVTAFTIASRGPLAFFMFGGGPMASRRNSIGPQAYRGR